MPAATIPGTSIALPERLVPLLVPIVDLKRDPKNPRRTKNLAALCRMLQEFGFTDPIVARAADGTIEAGHQRHAALIHLGATHAPAIFVDHDSLQARRYSISHNRANEVVAEWDISALAELVDALRLEDGGLDLPGFDATDLDALLTPQPENTGKRGRLSELFVVPPFTLLDARSGEWQRRKRAWLDAGIAPVEAPAVETANPRTWTSAGRGGSSSTFDPVLAELVYRWLAPQGARVLDPFAGGPARGLVAAALGRAYTGIDLRDLQVAANRAQWDSLHGSLRAVDLTTIADNTPEATPVQKFGDIWMKRDDLFAVAGACGGKVRTCWALAQGAEGLVTAGSRSSPQVAIVALIAARLGVPCRVHTPAGDPSPEVQLAIDVGAERVAHAPGHNSVIIARAREDARERGWTEIPFGMECSAAVEATAGQVVNIPASCSRIVVPVGSGMSLSGILWGLLRAGITTPVLGVVVGADPTRRLEKWAPKNWRDCVELVASGTPYDAAAEVTCTRGVELDEHYEAKAIPFLRAGDCLWVVGRRTSAQREQIEPACPTWVVGDSTLPVVVQSAAAGELFDLVFSCPPYGDLEVYSDDPADISGMPHSEFLRLHAKAIANAVALLRVDRFAAWVVGDFRGPDGLLRDFVSETIRAFRAAGADLYNEAILATSIGSAPVRAAQFARSRKLVKVHQNLLVFVKGSPAAAARYASTGV